MNYPMSSIIKKWIAGKLRQKIINMSIKKYLIFIVLYFPITIMYAQDLRHVPGINLVGASLGIAPCTEGSTHILELNYSKYLRNNLVLNIGGQYETGDVQTTKVKNYLFAGGIDYTAFQARNFLYFNVGLSVLAGGETLTSYNSEKKNSFVSGTAGNVNIETYFTNRIVLQIKAEQNYLPGSKLGNWYPAFHAGLKYCIF